MKKQYIRTVFLFFVFLFLFAFGGIRMLGRERSEVKTGTDNALVLLNEIEQLMPEEKDPAREQIIQEKTSLLKETLRLETTKEQIDKEKRFLLCFVCLVGLFLLFVFWFLYDKILRPFDKLEVYAERIAQGDLDVSLAYERTNFFGAFTWAFDHMRGEIITARKNEAQAVTENKTIIAALSHDIKTPLASIRAYAEGLEANLEADYEARERYLRVIMKKCDEVSRLVNDLVLHSLSELERLEIREQAVNMRVFLQETIQDYAGLSITLQEPVPEAVLSVDRKRLSQALFNILENAGKYAPGSRIDVWASAEGGRYEMHIRDYGNGICPEDMPFVKRKFYRGKNAEEKTGSGLGLYIVDYIMEKMGGGLELSNNADGLEACLWLDSGKNNG